MKNATVKILIDTEHKTSITTNNLMCHCFLCSLIDMIECKVHSEEKK